ncbi:hypothetical protein G7Y79_00025g057020 [Physcia stellaris]|nr:hypothetical protein G7Y79_00025g057020 [Physcia stellaris]
METAYFTIAIILWIFLVLASVLARQQKRHLQRLRSQQGPKQSAKKIKRKTKELGKPYTAIRSEVEINNREPSQVDSSGRRYKTVDQRIQDFLSQQRSTEGNLEAKEESIRRKRREENGYLVGFRASLKITVASLSTKLREKNDRKTPPGLRKSSPSRTRSDETIKSETRSPTPAAVKKPARFLAFMVAELALVIRCLLPTKLFQNLDTA